jgi:carboxyl-terminal processing protease
VAGGADAAAAYPAAMVRNAFIPAVIACLSILPAAEAPAPFPNMARVVGQVLDSYYDPKAFRPQVMVERALRALAEAEPAILATWRDQRIWLRFGDTAPARPIDAKTPTDLAEAMEILEQVRQAVASAAVTRSEDESRRRADGLPALLVDDQRHLRGLDYALFNGALATLDPHTVIMPPERAQEFHEEIQGEFFGIGAILRDEEGQVQIERVLPGLPAERGGIEDGDVILAVDGEKIAGLALPQAVRRIKGAKGTTVRLTLSRTSVEQPFDLAIVRDLVTPITERSARVGDIGYVRLDEFHAKAGQRLFDLVVGMQRERPLTGFVLDLRFNGGGLLDQARLISDFFLPGELEIVRTVGADGPPTKLRSTAPELLEVPMAVLVSPATASAAEIVSGSLQLHKRAVIIGEATFGKGSVQTIRVLADGSRLKLTIQEYQLPGGASIQATGVVPDVLLRTRTQAKDGRIDLQSYRGRREADDEFALLAHGTYTVTPSLTLAWLERFEDRDTARTHAIAAREFVPDQEARLAIDLLQSATGEAAAAAAEAHASGTLAPFLIDRLRAPVATRAESEQASIAQALAQASRPVVWGERNTDPAPAIQVSYVGPDELVPGTEATLPFVVENRSTAETGRLWGLIEADRRSALWEEELIIGRVAAGSATGASITFAVPPRLAGGNNAAPREERATLVVRADGSDTVLASVPLRFQIPSQPRPHLSYAWRIEDRTGAPRPTFAPDEQVFLRLTVINDGDGATGGPVDVAVFKDNDPFVVIDDSRRSTDGPVLAGTAVDLAPIRIGVKSSIRRDRTRDEVFTGDAVKLQLRLAERMDDGVRDGRGRAELAHALTIPLAGALPGGWAVQPRLSVDRIERDSSQAKVTLRAVDDDLRFLTLFQDRVKVDLQSGTALADRTAEPETLPAKIPGLASPSLTTYSWTATVDLQPGLNELRFWATDASRVDEVLDLRLWSDGPATAPAPVTPAVIP